ncbi:MAG: DUF2235 domain-containing protein [Bradyrhizobiaceae bacterium]|nr:DUF2235 domain-containing protein [Bradyrhizobiaceae bacterium]
MKRLAFCFDGTWNKLDAAQPTNVVLTAESVLPLAEDATQVIYYDEGVGTGDALDAVKGGMLGAGLLQNLADAYRFIVFNYTPGDQIYAFGFSRGAYTARSFAGLLSHCGILDRRSAARANDIIELYRSRDHTPAFFDKLMRFRSEHCTDTWVSDRERDWRQANAPQCSVDDTTRIQMTYLGVWDTVGALGVPKSFLLADTLNRKYEFHDTKLSPFVKSARHAVAIDEVRDEFEPTLWTNIEELNHAAGRASDDFYAPYQQKWFPGDHSSVGGSADWRGLSDQALHWVWIGAMQQRLKFDTSQNSRIFELAPKFTERLIHSDDPSMSYRVMAARGSARKNGPKHLYEVSYSAQRRWHESPDMLSDDVLYRPDTLKGVSAELEKLDPVRLGVGPKYRKFIAEGDFEKYTVKRKDGLRAIARKFYGTVEATEKIFDANRDLLEHPDLIFADQVLRLPTDGLQMTT